MNCMKLVGANYFASVRYDTKKITDAPLGQQPRDAFHIVAMSTNALPHIEVFLQDLKDQQDHAMMMSPRTRVQLGNSIYTVDVFALRNQVLSEDSPLYAFAARLDKDMCFTTAGASGNIAFNKKRLLEVWRELDATDEDEFFSYAEDGDVIVVFINCNAAEAMEAVKKSFKISGEVWCIPPKNAVFNEAVARIAINNLRTTGVCIVEGYAFYYRGNWDEGPDTLEADVWKVMGGNYVPWNLNPSVNLFDVSTWTLAAKAAFSKLRFLDVGKGKIAYDKSKTDFILDALEHCTPMIFDGDEITICASGCTAKDAKEAIANDAEELSIVVGSARVTIVQMLEAARIHFNSACRPTTGEFMVADHLVRYRNKQHAGQAVVDTVETFFSGAPSSDRVYVATPVTPSDRRKICAALLECLKHSPVVDTVLFGTRVVACFQPSELTEVEDALYYSVFNKQPIAPGSRLKIVGSRRESLKSMVAKVKVPLQPHQFKLGSYKIPAAGCVIEVTRGISQEDRVEALIIDYLDRPALKDRVYVRGVLEAPHAIPDLLNAFDAQRTTAGHFNMHGVFVAYSLGKNERIDAHAVLLNKLNAMAIAKPPQNTEQLAAEMPPKPDAGAHYADYHTNGDQWIDTMKQTRFQDPVRMEAVCEINVRKYLDRLGRKDNKIQELTKSAKWLVYWILYLKTGGKATMKDVHKIFENI